MATNRAGYDGPYQGMFAPVAGSSKWLAFDGTSAMFTAGALMGTTETWLFTCDADCYVAQGNFADTPAASAGDGSTLVPAGSALLVDGSEGDQLAVIQSSAGGNATLTKLKALI